MAACGLTGGPFEGKVYDEQTGEPIAGAYVAVTWTGEAGLFVDSQSVCVHAEVAVSDESGHFHVGRWVNIDSVGVMMDPHVSASAYMRGYKMADSYFPSKLAMVSDARSNLERLEYLANRVIDCSDNSDGINAFNRQLLQEAQSIAKTSEDKEYVESILYSVEINEMGFELATKRLKSRRKKIN